MSLETIHDDMAAAVERHAEAVGAAARKVEGLQKAEQDHVEAVNAGARSFYDSPDAVRRDYGATIERVRSEADRALKPLERDVDRIVADAFWIDADVAARAGAALAMPGLTSRDLARLAHEHMGSWTWLRGVAGCDSKFSRSLGRQLDALCDAAEKAGREVKGAARRAATGRGYTGLGLYSGWWRGLCDAQLGRLAHEVEALRELVGDAR